MCSAKSGANTVNNPSSEASRLLASPEATDGVVHVKDWAWAQARTNFVIVGPKPGSGWLMRGQTLRGESAEHYSTVRAIVANGSGARLRMKQFLNDWWIPTVADISFRGQGTPVAYADAVAFVGRDYKRQAASCGHAWGTNVEFSVEEGDLGEEDWKQLWASLDALVPAALPAARRASFAARNYWNRWGRSNAPWDTTEISSLQWSEPTTQALEAVAWSSTPATWAPLPGAVDSIGIRAHPQWGEEMQAVFRRPMDLEYAAWLRAFRTAPKEWVPLIDESEVNRPRWEEIPAGERTVRRACMDPTVGNWMYAWRDGDRAYELHLRARRGLDGENANAVVRGFLGQT